MLRHPAGHDLIWAGPAGGTWTTFNWALYPIDASHTRLVSRIRWSHHGSEPSLIGLDLSTEFADHLAVRKILQSAEVGVYVASAVTLPAALLLVLASPVTRRRWLAGLAAVVAWLVIWWAPVPLWVGILVGLAALRGLVRARVRTGAGRPGRTGSSNS